MRKITIVSALLFSVLVLSRCNCNKEKVEVVEPSDADSTIARLNNEVLADTTGQFVQVAGAPTVWQAFETFFKTCVKNSSIKDYSLFSKYRLLYLGPTNSKYLGTVYSGNGVETKTELTRWLTSNQLDQFIAKGNPVPGCDVSTIKEQFISIALGNIPFVGTDTTLKFVLSRRDSIVNSVGNWTIDEIKTSDFVKYLNENISQADVKYYRDVMVKKNNVVAFKVVKISGFEADLKFNRGIGIEVDLNIPIAKTKLTTGSDSTLCAFRFTKTNNTTVHLKTEGEFYAFALVMKGKNVGK